jgi:hypothetical protein
MIPATSGNTHSALAALVPGAKYGMAAFLILFGMIVAGSNLIAALAGFGGNLLALPFLAWITGDLKLSVILVLLLGTGQAVIMAAANSRHVQLKPLAGLAGWSALGIPAGLLLAARLPQQAMLLGLGLVVLAGGIAGFFTVSSHLLSRPLRLVDRALLILGGVLHGAAGCGGLPVVIAARHILPAKESFRGTIFVFWIFLDVVVLIGLAWHASLKQPLLLAVLGLPCMIAGSYVGERLSRRISQNAFARMVALLLVVSGLMTIGRALAGT